MGELQLMNEFGKSETPFLFVLDFELKTPVIMPLDQVDDSMILYNINGTCNFEHKEYSKKKLEFSSQPAKKNRYEKVFISI